MNIKRGLFYSLVICAILVLAILLQKVFAGQIILQQVFYIVGIPVHFYGLILGIAILAGIYFAKHRARFYQLPEEKLENVFLIILVFGFIGARLYHVFSSFEYYQSHVVEVFYVQNGGLGIFGAVFGGFIGLLFAKKLFLPEVKLLTLLDWLAPSVILSQIIGRFGNLFNYEAFGIPSSLPWKMFVPVEFRPIEYFPEQYFHPLFLYESLAGLLILLILLRCNSFLIRYRISLLPGAIFWLWLWLYFTVRFGTEVLRADSVIVYGVKQNLVVAVIIIVFGLIRFIKSIKVGYESRKT